MRPVEEVLHELVPIERFEHVEPAADEVLANEAAECRIVLGE